MSIEQSQVADAPHVLIVGGGISGLVTAYSLQEQARATGTALRCTVLESDPRLGGKLVTDRLDGFIVEGGPDSFLVQKPWAVELCRRLGLDDDLIPTVEANRKVYVLRHGRLVRLPEGVNLVVPTRWAPFLRSPLLSWAGKLRMALDLILPARTQVDDESIGSFIGRRFGREAVEVLAEPLMCGIHTAAPEYLSTAATFERFRELERKHGSLIRALRKQTQAGRKAQATAGRPSSPFLSLRGGVRQLVEALEAALEDVSIQTGTVVATIAREGKRYQVRTTNGATYTADAVVLATPAHVSARLVAELAPDLATALARIRYVSSATVSLAFRRSDVRHPLDGTGFVVPRIERRRIFGGTWNSSKFQHRAPDDDVLLRAFVGGAGREEQLDRPDDELVAVVRDELRQIMAIDAEPILARVYRWQHANPQYEVGHLDRVRHMHRMAAELGELYLTGSAYEGVGIPDCVRQAEATAAQVMARLAAEDVVSPALVDLPAGAPTYVGTPEAKTALISRSPGVSPIRFR